MSKRRPSISLSVGLGQQDFRSDVQDCLKETNGSVGDPQNSKPDLTENGLELGHNHPRIKKKQKTEIKEWENKHTKLQTAHA